MPTAKHSLCPHQRNTWRPPAPKAEGTLQKSDFKSPWIREFAMILYLLIILEAIPQSLTNTTTCGEQGWHQWPCHTGWREVHETSTLHKTLEATAESWEWERSRPQGKSTRVVCRVPNTQLWQHNTSNSIQTGQAIFRNTCICTYIDIDIHIHKCDQWLTKKEAISLKKSREEYMEELRGGLGGRKGGRKGRRDRGRKGENVAIKL